MDQSLVERLERTIKVLESSHSPRVQDLDSSVERMWREWLGEDLHWTGLGITDDEWFFITTLCGSVTVDAQRSHIRGNLPVFEVVAEGQIARLDAELLGVLDLGTKWMRTRLGRMASVLRRRGQSMIVYTDGLRELDLGATPSNPTPALDKLRADHDATSWKTLSLFVRDCVLGSCFPIDSRVEYLLGEFNLPNDERRMVSACLALGRNPRDVSRLFYDAGGKGDFFTTES